jgi:hypothetical protein
VHLTAQPVTPHHFYKLMVQALLALVHALLLGIFLIWFKENAYHVLQIALHVLMISLVKYARPPVHLNII